MKDNQLKDDRRNRKYSQGRQQTLRKMSVFFGPLALIGSLFNLVNDSREIYSQLQSTENITFGNPQNVSKQDKEKLKLLSSSLSSLNNISTNATMTNATINTNFTNRNTMNATSNNNNNTMISWPQVDDRIGQAIRNGYWIKPNRTFLDENKTQYIFNNIKYEAQPNQEKLATVVTCYYHVKGKHAWLNYKHWMSNMLSATDPMIIFVDHTTYYANMNWFEEVQKNRQHAPTIIVKYPFKNLTMSTQFDETFWLKQQSVQTNFRRVVTESYRIYNEKPLLMKEVAIQNPFETEHFIWVDIGYFRDKRRTTIGNINKAIVRNNISQNGIEPGKMLFYSVYKEPCPQEIGAGVFGGTKDAILEFNKKYWLSFWYMVSQGLKVTYEQRIMITMCRSWPHLCRLVYSGRDDDWFKLGKSWIRTPTFNFTSVYHKVSQEPFNISLVPEKYRHQIIPITNVNDTSMVNFPTNGEVITETTIAKFYNNN